MGLNGKEGSVYVMSGDEYEGLVSRLIQTPLTGEKFGAVTYWRKKNFQTQGAVRVLDRDIPVPAKTHFEETLKEGFRNAQCCPTPCCGSFANRWFEGANPKQEDHFEILSNGEVDPFERNDFIIKNNDQLAIQFVSWLHKFTQ